MVVKTVEALKREQIGNICLFADSEGVGRPYSMHMMCVLKVTCVVEDAVLKIFCPAAVGFYEQLGFKCDPDGVRCLASPVMGMLNSVTPGILLLVFVLGCCVCTGLLLTSMLERCASCITDCLHLRRGMFWNQ